MSTAPDADGRSHRIVQRRYQASEMCLLAERGRRRCGVCDHRRRFEGVYEAMRPDGLMLGYRRRIRPDEYARTRAKVFQS